MSSNEGCEIMLDPQFLFEAGLIDETEFNKQMTDYNKQMAVIRDQKTKLPDPPPPKAGCICDHIHNSDEYNKPHQPLNCPGGDLCFTKVEGLNGRALTRAIHGLIRSGICVCTVKYIRGPSGPRGVSALRKERREKTPRCACGNYFSNAVVRKLGLFSKTEWLKQGYRVKKDTHATAHVWRTVYWKGKTGGSINLVGLYNASQVEPLKGERERQAALDILDKLNDSNTGR